MSLATGHRPKKLNVTDRRVKTNPKYDHIKGKVTTGMSVTRYMSELEEKRRNFRYRKGEIFKRMKASTLAELMWEVAMEAEEERRNYAENHPPATAGDEEDDLAGGGGGGDFDDGRSVAHSTLQTVITGLGEVDIQTARGDPRQPRAKADGGGGGGGGIAEEQECPFLLLDLRDADAFAQCHVVDAVNYPHTTLNRSCNYFSKEILRFKNHPGRLIVIYDEDERIAPQSASIFVERGVENVYMLSGGLKVLAKHFPFGLVAGQLPPSCLSPPPTDRRGSPKRRGASSSKLPPPPPTASINLKLTKENLMRIRDQLDEVQEQEALRQQSSRMSSRGPGVTSRAVGGGNRPLDDRRGTSSRATVSAWRG